MSTNSGHCCSAINPTLVSDCCPLGSGSKSKPRLFVTGKYSLNSSTSEITYGWTVHRRPWLAWHSLSNPLGQAPDRTLNLLNLPHFCHQKFYVILLLDFFPQQQVSLFFLISQQPGEGGLPGVTPMVSLILSELEHFALYTLATCDLSVYL